MLMLLQFFSNLQVQAKMFRKLNLILSIYLKERERNRDGERKEQSLFPFVDLPCKCTQQPGLNQADTGSLELHLGSHLGSRNANPSAITSCF